MRARSTGQEHQTVAPVYNLYFEGHSFAIKAILKDSRMLKDRYGNPLSTTSDAAQAAYIDAVDRFLAAEGGVEEAFQAAIAADGNFALAHMGLARFYQMRGDKALIAAPLDKALSLQNAVSPQEAGQINTLGLLLQGKVGAAVANIHAHLADYPRDVMISQTCMGVFGLIGFSGQPGREAEQLAFTTALAPHYGDDWWFLSMHAFAQVEVGQIARAEKNIENSLNTNPRSAHGAHIRAHLYYENGDATAGAHYLDTWRQTYDKTGMLHCHIAWHVALWALELGDEKTMWRVYDADIAPGAALGPPINILTDAAALLYRAELAGIDIAAARWRVLSEYATQFFPKPGLAFVDVHAALAHAMAGDTVSLSKIISDAKGPAAEFVRGFAQAFEAVIAKKWDLAVSYFTVAMSDHARVGGSNAQRDLLELATAFAMLRAGHDTSARTMLSMRRPIACTPSMMKGLK